VIGIDKLERLKLLQGASLINEFDRIMIACLEQILV
jgi:hypothetical protein